MGSPQPTLTDRQIAELEARLAEAEQTLEAIRNGEVDALVVAGPDGDQVFSLRGAETTYRFLVEEMNEGALLLTSDGTILYANKRFARLTNAPLEVVIGSGWERFFPVTERDRLNGMLTAANAFSIREELQLVRTDGFTLPVGISLSLMQRDKGRGFCAVITDLTERKTAEAALQAANEELELRVARRTGQLAQANALLLEEIEERKRAEQALSESERREHERAGELAVLIEAIPTPVIIVHDPGSRHMSANRAAQKLLRLSPGDEVSLSAPEESRPTHFKAFMDRRELRTEEMPAQRSARGEHLEDFEFNLVFDDGTVRVILAYGTPLLDGQGRPRGAVHTLVDITERKQAEAVLERSREELERLVARRTSKLQEMIGELQHISYSIVHDLRAPLRAIQGFATLLQEEDAVGTDERREYCRRIAQGAQRLDLQITDALQYTKAVLQDLPMRAVDLVKVMREVVDSYPDLQPAKARISFDDNLPAVWGNESLLTQCFSNLLRNAVKFVRPGNRPEVRVRAETAGDKARVWVEDNGIGIPEYAQKRLFGMFERHAPEYEGNGIGLAIVRKVVERMGGKVGVESQEGKGSRFWVELSIARDDGAKSASTGQVV